MKIAIMGTGGVGGFYGARLANAGYDVHFIARGAHLAAIKEKGLTVESSLGKIHLQDPKVTDNPSEIPPVDLILFSVKLWDTESAAKSIKPLLKEDTAVISLQNGVQKDDILKSILGESHVLGGICYIAASIQAPGVIKQAGKETLTFGEYRDKETKRAKAILEAFLKAGINASISDHIERTIWEKFVFLVGFSGTTTAMRATLGSIRSNKDTRAFLLDCMQEAVDVALRLKVDITPDYAENRLKHCDTMPEWSISSMAGDLKRGNRLELPWLSGAVVDLGKKLGLSTPVNRAIYDILILHAVGTL